MSSDEDEPVPDLPSAPQTMQRGKDGQGSVGKSTLGKGSVGHGSVGHGSLRRDPFDGSRASVTPSEVIIARTNRGSVQIKQDKYSSMASVTTIQGQEKPPNYLTLALLSFMCCNFVPGSCAIYLSFASDKWYKYGNLDRARKFGNLAKMVSIATMLIGFATYIVVAVMFVKHPVPAFSGM